MKKHLLSIFALGTTFVLYPTLATAQEELPPPPPMEEMAPPPPLMSLHYRHNCVRVLSTATELTNLSKMVKRLPSLLTIAFA